MRTAHRLARVAGLGLLAGTLAFASAPAAALAAGAGDSSGSGSQMEAPDGSGGNGSGGGADATDPGSSGGAGNGSSSSGGSGGGSADTMTFDYSDSYTGAIEADGTEVSSEGETYEATATDQNAALAQDGGTLSLTDAILSKSGDDTDGDSCNFYGVNSIALSVGEGSLLTLLDSTLTATSEGSNAVFATDGATAYVKDVSISTSADNSRGLDATYGGTIVATGVTIQTEGAHCASVATDRGGGYVSVTDSTFSTAGEGSPLLYSTGDVEASGVTGTATGSQIAGMEGLNTILINGCTLTSTITAATASDPVANAVIIYQSTSGDAEASTGETATFQVANSTLSSAIESGSFFYLTNTSAELVLYNSTIDFDTSAANLLTAAGNDANNWGTAGSNGATVKVTAIAQELAGTIEADTISSVALYLTDGSTWEGAAKISQNSAGSTVDEPLSVNVDATSTWVVTESCELSNLTVAEGGQVVDADGATVTIVAGGKTVVEGASDLTVTVTGAYSTAYDASEEGALTADLIDRTAFDEYFGCDTTWSMGDGTVATASSDSDEAADDTAASTESAEAGETGEESATNGLVAFFQGIIDWFFGLFN